MSASSAAARVSNPTNESNRPLVSFIVPCYKLAHLLAECVGSILSQTFSDFEVLIMDDCSPDNTPEVARSFTDPRVIHVRNQPNLGHLRNYNKGIRMARGKYIWLISADDKLRSNNALERYVKVLEEHPQVGYAFCSGYCLDGDRETQIIQSSLYRQEDGIFRGREFLLDLLKGNFVLAASGMARKECYERVSYFPEDMPYAGDWYLWAIYAAHYDVAYFAEPMVDYRVHDLSMSTIMSKKDTAAIFNDYVGVPTRMRHEGERLRDAAIVKRCRETVTNQYAICLSSRVVRDQRTKISLQEFESSLARFTESPEEQRDIRWRVFCGAGDHCCWQQEYEDSARFYRLALGIRPFLPTVWLKLLLLKSGRFGAWLRDALGGVRQLAKS